MRSDTDTVTLLDVLDVATNLDGLADDLMTNNASYALLACLMANDRLYDLRYGVGPQPELSMCKSEPQIPQ